MSIFDPHMPSMMPTISETGTWCRYWSIDLPGMDIILPHYVNYRQPDPNGPKRDDVRSYAECFAYAFDIPGKPTQYRNPYNLKPPVYVGDLWTLEELEAMGVPHIPEGWIAPVTPWALASEIFAKGRDSVIVTRRSYHIINPGDIVDPDNWEG